MIRCSNTEYQNNLSHIANDYRDGEVFHGIMDVFTVLGGSYYENLCSESINCTLSSPVFFIISGKGSGGWSADLAVA